MVILPVLSFSQNSPWNYFGSDINEAKQKIDNYLFVHGYKGELFETDSTLELITKHDSATWTIFTIFYFDSKGKCYALSNRRCDSIGQVQFKQLLEHKDYAWKEIGFGRYLSKRKYSQLLENMSYQSCTMYKKTKLNLSKKEYDRLLSHQLSN